MPILKIDVLFGGQSREHDVSIVSALSIINGLVGMRRHYEVWPVYITQDGEWYRAQTPLFEQVNELNLRNLVKTGCLVSPSLNPTHKIYHSPKGPAPLPDIYFPVLHGTKGEDGTIQGLFEMMNIPYVGSGVIGGSCGMDKEIMKRLFHTYGLPLLRWKCFEWIEWKKNSQSIVRQIKKNLSYPLFIKPANLGSSVGISKVTGEKTIKKAIREAFSYDQKIVVEEGRNVREIECSILGNHSPRVSEPGEIIPSSEFYDYQDKYCSNKARLCIPALLTAKQVRTIKEMAITAFKAVNARGLSRVDFFICKKNGRIFVNEINTFPGFTQISMYPKLWECSHVSFSDLLNELIKLGMERRK
ncbi:MAG: D-alanine--D-alanine ligase [Candidatus Aureabacteria bacterium]|nr:D-alanine--D-alanine ligase [Candidatus Auribacterota bacterium]